MLSNRIYFTRVFAIALTVILMLSLLASVPFKVRAFSSDEYEYDILCDGTLKITDYNGNATEYTIPSQIDNTSVTRIDSYAFGDCDSLTTVTIPSGIKSIGVSAFQGCSALTTVTIPADLFTISQSAFKNCTALTTISIDDENTFYSSVDGNLFNKNITELIQYAIGKDESSYTIPDTVKKISSEAFYKANIASITIPNTITSIGDYAFTECEALTNITYIGTEDEFSEIEIGVGNEKLSTATITFSPKICTHSNLDIDEPVAPTCEKAGLTIGRFCVDCGIFLNEQRAVKAKGHTTSVKNKKSATYFVKGYTGDTVCTVCNKIIAKGKATAKKTLKVPKVTLTKGKKKFKVKYTKVSGATGFEVQYKVGKKLVSKTFNTKKSATNTIKKLKNGTYKVKVRAFVKSGKKKVYSKWTKTRTIKI